MGERLDILAFRPLFIYNSYKNACQEQAVLPPVLRWNIAYSGRRPSYIILSSSITENKSDAIYH